MKSSNLKFIIQKINKIKFSKFFENKSFEFYFIMFEI